VFATSEIRAIVEAPSKSEMLVNVYESTRRNNPEDGHLHTHRRQKLKGHVHEVSLNLCDAILKNILTETVDIITKLIC
jgi:hypothetical protein